MKIQIVGISDDGLEGLSASARALIQRADLLIGNRQTIDAVSNSPALAEHAPECLLIGNDLDGVVEWLEQDSTQQIVVLAPGDPLFYGMARYLCDRLGKDRFEVVPHVSSMQLAFARVKESWDEAYLTNLSTQNLDRVAERIRTADKVGIFTTDESPPASVAKFLLDRRIDYFSAYVCENLGAPDERVTHGQLTELLDQQFSPLNVMILIRNPGTPDRPRPLVGQRLFGNPDEMFLQSKPKRGLLTPSEVRTIALAHLNLSRDSIVWDVGAGSGSVSVEAAQLATDGTIYAIEMDVEDFTLISANAERFGLSNLVPVLGTAPDAWSELPEPDAIFVEGTGRNVAKLLQLAYHRLRNGGRLVANVMSLDNLADAKTSLNELAGESHVMMINIARGSYQLEAVRFEALNPAFLISVSKPA